MKYEMLLGLQIHDPEQYQNYRNAMRPLLEQHGGGFRYDFWVAETLATETNNEINRVFVIYFSDEAQKTAFFSNTEYLAIKQEFFETSVTSITVIAEYSVAD